MRLRNKLLSLIAVFTFVSPVLADDLDKASGAYIGGEYSTAFQMWKSYAEQGNVRAQYSIGMMYYHGEGVLQDYKEAVKWFTKAANQGFPFSQNTLGIMYGNGEGVPQDYVQAYMWFNLAATSGLQDAISNRDIASEKMTPSQIEKAQELSRKKWAEINK